MEQGSTKTLVHKRMSCHLPWFIIVEQCSVLISLSCNWCQNLFSPTRKWDKDTSGLSVYLRCLHHPPPFHRGHNKLDKRKKALCFRRPDSGSLLWKYRTKDFTSCFRYYYDNLWANKFTPLPWFVNTCVCTVLLWVLDTGKETYIVFMRIKQKTMKKKKSVIMKKAHVFLNVPTFFCQNVYFLVTH